MTFNAACTEWHLVQERCDNCQLSPSHLSCARCGKQQLAFIRHHRCHVGDGISHALELRIPGIYANGQPIIWCSALGRRDLGHVEENGSHETQLMTTKKP